MSQFSAYRISDVHMACPPPYFTGVGCDFETNHFCHAANLREGKS